MCAGITPFNFPAMIPLWMFPMAIACGNTFVLKPSEQDPMVTMRLVELALEAGIPKGVLNVVHGGEDVGQRAVRSRRHPRHLLRRVDPRRHRWSTTAPRKAGKRVQCMMGAKNHAVVLPDAHKEQTLNALVGAAFGAAGQRCMAVSVAVLVGAAREWLPDLIAKAAGAERQRR